MASGTWRLRAAVLRQDTMLSTVSFALKIDVSRAYLGWDGPWGTLGR